MSKISQILKIVSGNEPSCSFFFLRKVCVRYQTVQDWENEHFLKLLTRLLKTSTLVCTFLWIYNHGWNDNFFLFPRVFTLFGFGNFYWLWSTEKVGITTKAAKPRQAMHCNLRNAQVWTGSFITFLFVTFLGSISNFRKRTNVAAIKSQIQRRHKERFYS